MIPYATDVGLLINLEAIKAKSPKINPEMTPIIGPVINIKTFGLKPAGILLSISASFG